MSEQKPSARDLALARYRERAGDAWKPSDDILFTAAWCEGAYERDQQAQQARQQLYEARELLVRATGALAVTAPKLADAIIRYLSGETP